MAITVSVTEDLEIQLLLEGIWAASGIDFRKYAPASLKRRILAIVQDEQAGTISGLLAKVLHDQEAFARLLDSMTVNVTSLFRDPPFYAAIRETVIPLLRANPFIRIWHPGCSTGEEAYSMSILVAEAALSKRTRIYATDLNERVLAQASQGIYPLQLMQAYTENYIQAGGQRAFSEYYSAAEGHAILNMEIRNSIVWARHSLVTDASFNEFHCICCRNAMIYFNKELQHSVHKLLYNSLTNFGLLLLGKSETLRSTPFEDRYIVVDQRNRIYKKVK